MTFINDAGSSNNPKIPKKDVKKAVPEAPVKQLPKKKSIPGEAPVKQLPPQKQLPPEPAIQNDEITTFLKENNLPLEYRDKLVNDGFDDLDSLKDLTEQDLIDMGIDKKGHRKKILRKGGANIDNTMSPEPPKPVPTKPIPNKTLPSKQLPNKPSINENKEPESKGNVTSHPTKIIKIKNKYIELIKQSNGIRAVKLYFELNEYIVSEKGKKGKGLMIKDIKNNDCGINMKKCGINIGWELIKMDKKDVTKTGFMILNNQLQNACSLGGKHGYILTFKGTESISMNKPTSPRAPKLNKKGSNDGQCCVLKSEGKSHDQKKTWKTIKFYEKLTLFFESKSKTHDNKGFLISKVLNNEYGNKLKELGVKENWQLIKIGKRDVSSSQYAMLLKQIGIKMDLTFRSHGNIIYERRSSRSNSTNKSNNNNNNSNNNIKPKKPFNKPSINFDKPKIDKSQWENRPLSSKIKSPKHKNGSSNNSNRVQIISDSDNIKVVRLFHGINKYVEGVGINGKGFKIKELTKYFGSDFLNVGLGINWELIKIGDKNVSKTNHMIVKTNLEASWKNNMRKGFIVTFKKP